MQELRRSKHGPVTPERIPINAVPRYLSPGNERKGGKTLSQTVTERLKARTSTASFATKETLSSVRKAELTMTPKHLPTAAAAHLNAG